MALGTEPDRTTRNESVLRFFLWQLGPEEAQHLIHKERAYQRVALETYTAMVRDQFDPSPWGTLPLQPTTGC